MPTAEEIVVALRSEGAEETQSDLQGVDEQLDETKGSLSDTSDEMQGFSRKMRGAMRSVIAGLAVAAAGLLSQVPVIGEAFSGLRAIFDALVLQIDSELRPGLTGLTNDLYDVAAAIHGGEETQGLLPALVDVGEELQNINENIRNFSAEVVVDVIFDAPEFAVEHFIPEDPSEVSVNDIFDLTFDVVTLMSGLGLAAAIVIEFKQRLRTEMQGVDWAQFGRNIAIDITDGVMATDWSSVAEDVVGLIKRGMPLYLASQVGVAIGREIWSGIASMTWGDLVDLLITFIKRGSPMFLAYDIGTDLSKQVWDGLTDRDWVGVGENIVREVIDGLKNMKDQAANAAAEVAGEIGKHFPNSPAEEGPLSTIDESGPALVDEFASGIDANASRLESAASSLAGAADPTNQNPRRANAAGGFMAQRETSPTILVDGRDITQSTGRYRRDETSRRGRES